MEDVRALKLAKKLIYAAEEGDLRAVEVAIKSGAAINTLEGEVSALPAWPAGGALHWAAVNGDEALLRYLLEKGADIELRTLRGKTPLLVAAEALSIAGCRALLQAGADVNAVGPAGETALHIVAWEMSGAGTSGAGALRSRGYAEAEAIAMVLFEHGARVDIKTDAGFTALQTNRPSVGVVLSRLREDVATRALDDAQPRRAAGPDQG